MSFAAKLHVSNDVRRSDRYAADIDGTLRGVGATMIDVRVIDIAQHGFRCTTTADLREGDPVRIGLRGKGDGNAIVRWRRGAQIGCEFVRPLNEIALRTALSADVIEAVAQWGTTGPVPPPGRAATGRIVHPARLLTILLVAALLADLLKDYSSLAI